MPRKFAPDYRYGHAREPEADPPPGAVICHLATRKVSRVVKENGKQHRKLFAIRCEECRNKTLEPREQSRCDCPWLAHDIAERWAYLDKAPLFIQGMPMNSQAHVSRRKFEQCCAAVGPGAAADRDAEDED